MHLEPPHRTRNLDVNELVVLVVCPLSFSVFPSRQPASDQQTRAALSNQQHSWRRRRPQCASHSRHAGSVAEAATSQGHRDWRAGGSLLRHPAAFSRSRRPPVRLGCAMLRRLLALQQQAMHEATRAVRRRWCRRCAATAVTTPGRGRTSGRPMPPCRTEGQTVKQTPYHHW